MVTMVVDRNKVRDYLKFRPVSTKGERIAVRILIPVVLVVVLMFWGIPPLHIIPVWGPSMQPTLAVWNVPEPWERLSFSGWVHYDPERKPEIGSIVYFRIPDTKIREVKRVAKINSEGELWVEPDNPGISGEGSDNSELYDWVKPEWIIGVVSAMLTPARTARWFTQAGRFYNQITFKDPPRDILWMDEVGLVAAGSMVYQLSGDFVARFPSGFKLLYLTPAGLVASKSEGELVTLLIYNPTPGVIVEGRASHNYTGGIIGFQPQIDGAVEGSGHWTYFQYETEPTSPFS